MSTSSDELLVKLHNGDELPLCLYDNKFDHIKVQKSWILHGY